MGEPMRDVQILPPIGATEPVEVLAALLERGESDVGKRREIAASAIARARARYGEDVQLNVFSGKGLYVVSVGLRSQSLGNVNRPGAALPAKTLLEALQLVGLVDR